MTKRTVVAHPAAGPGDGSQSDTQKLFEQMPVPTLDERANFYLRAVFGEREFSDDEYSDARGLLLDAMAADIVEQSNIRASEGSSLRTPFSDNVEYEGLTSFTHADFPIPTSEPDDERHAVGGADEHVSTRSADELQGATLRLPPVAGRFPKRIALACAGAVLVTAAVLGTVLTAWFGPNNPSEGSRAAASLPEPSGRTATGPGPDLMAEAEREVATALNASQLPAEEVSALLKHGQELIAQGNLRLARLVLRQAAESGSAAAAFALGRTYDPSIRDSSAMRSDAPLDIAMARAWYQKAKDMGSAEAAYRLSQLPAAVPTPAIRSDRK